MQSRLHALKLFDSYQAVPSKCVTFSASLEHALMRKVSRTQTTLMIHLLSPHMYEIQTY